MKTEKRYTRYCPKCFGRNSYTKLFSENNPKVPCVHCGVKMKTSIKGN